MISSNPINDAHARQAQEERYLEHLPVCSECGETITDDFYDIVGEAVCDECIEKHRIRIDQYVQMMEEEEECGSLGF